MPAGETPGLLQDFVVLFTLAVLVVLGCHRLRLPAIIGFLITGVIAGPHGLGLIRDPDSVESLAEIGVVLLLFTVGIDFSLERLYRIRSAVIAGGGLQVVLTATVTAAIAWFIFTLSLPQSLFLGLLVAPSSTAVVLKLLSEKAEVDTPQGRIALGILIFQDLCVVPMMVATPFLAGKGGDAWSAALIIARAVLLVIGAAACGRYVFPWLLHLVVRTRNREVFLLAIIILCLGTAWLSALAGLSLALGAFLAGLIVSRSEYSQQALGEIAPFRDAFSSLFFISIGMLLDLGTFGKPFLLASCVGGLVLLKALLAGGVTLALGYGHRVAVISGLMLAQVGEFSFVLARPGLEYGILDQRLYQFFLAAAVTSMALTPLLKAAGPYLSTRIDPLARRLFRRLTPTLAIARLEEAPREHVVILGYGVTGRNLARVLKHVSIPYVVVEMNPETVAAEKAKGEPIFYGDANRQEILEHAGIHDARVLVIAISDAASIRRITHLARQLAPGLHIIVRTRYLAELEPLVRLGASEVVPEEFETSLEIFARTLRKLLVPRDVVEKIVRQVRFDGYGILRTSDRACEPLQLLPGAELEVLRVERGSPLRGKALEETALRQETGASILALHDGKEFVLNPPATARLEEGASAIVFGSPEQLARAAALFRGDGEPAIRPDRSAAPLP